MQLRKKKKEREGENQSVGQMCDGFIQRGGEQPEVWVLSNIAWSACLVRCSLRLQRERD